MRHIKLLALAGAFCLVPVANAQIFYNVLVSDVAFQPSGANHAIPWVTTGPNNEVITFQTGSVPVIVGDATGNAAATVNIIYEVDATNVGPLGQIDMVFSALVIDFGRIFWSEIVETMAGQVVSSASGAVLGGSYVGGSNGVFVIQDSLTFPAMTQYRVKKNFFLDIDGDTLPTNSLASLGYVEQAHIPEPATLAALGIGLAAIAARRRRK